MAHMRPTLPAVQQQRRAARPRRRRRPASSRAAAALPWCLGVGFGAGPRCPLRAVRGQAQTRVAESACASLNVGESCSYWPDDEEGDGAEGETDAPASMVPATGHCYELARYEMLGSVQKPSAAKTVLCLRDGTFVAPVVPRLPSGPSSAKSVASAPRSTSALSLRDAAIWVANGGWLYIAIACPALCCLVCVAASCTGRYLAAQEASYIARRFVQLPAPVSATQSSGVQPSRKPWKAARATRSSGLWAAKARLNGALGASSDVSGAGAAAAAAFRHMSPDRAARHLTAASPASSPAASLGLRSYLRTASGRSLGEGFGASDTTPDDGLGYDLGAELRAAGLLPPVAPAGLPSSSAPGGEGGRSAAAESRWRKPSAVGSGGALSRAVPAQLRLPDAVVQRLPPPPPPQSPLGSGGGSCSGGASDDNDAGNACTSQAEPTAEQRRGPAQMMRSLRSAHANNVASEAASASAPVQPATIGRGRDLLRTSADDFFVAAIEQPEFEDTVALTALQSRTPKSNDGSRSGRSNWRHRSQSPASQSPTLAAGSAWRRDALSPARKQGSGGGGSKWEALDEELRQTLDSADAASGVASAPDTPSLLGRGLGGSSIPRPR